MARSLSFPVWDDPLDDLMKEVIVRRFPEVKVFYKSSSTKMWLLYLVSFMWIWNRRYMKGYISVFGTNVYFPDDILEGKEWQRVHDTMRHEFIHMLQGEDNGILFELGYLFPQIFALLSLPSIMAIWFGPWWLLSLCFLIFLAPIPAPFRKAWELEGYTQTMLVRYERDGAVPPWVRDKILDQFVGFAYYLMWPFKESLKKSIDGIARKIESEEISGPYLHYPS